MTIEKIIVALKHSSEFDASQAQTILSAFRTCKFISLTSNFHIESMSFENKMKTFITIDLMNNSNIDTRVFALKKALEFFKKMQFVKFKLLSKEKRKLKRVFQNRQKQIKTAFDVFLKLRISKNSCEN